MLVDFLVRVNIQTISTHNFTWFSFLIKIFECCHATHTKKTLILEDMHFVFLFFSVDFLCYLYIMIIRKKAIWPFPRMQISIRPYWVQLWIYVNIPYKIELVMDSVSGAHLYSMRLWNIWSFSTPVIKSYFWTRRTEVRALIQWHSCAFS